MSEPRRNTKSARDFAWWCRVDIGDEFPLATDKGLTGINSDDGLDGTDLVNYGLEQVGLPTKPNMSRLFAFVSTGPLLTTEVALVTPGALLFASNYLGIVTNKSLVTVEPYGRFYRTIINTDPLALIRWTSAYMYPGMTK